MPFYVKAWRLQQKPVIIAIHLDFFFFNYFLYSVISYIFFIGRSTWCNYFFHGVLFMELPTVHISLRAHSVIIKCQFFCYQYLLSIIISIKWLSPFWKCMLQSLDFNYDFHWRSFLSSCTWWFILRYIYLHKMHVTLQKWILKCSLQRMLALHAVFFVYVETCQICDDHWILLLICGAVKFQLIVSHILSHSYMNQLLLGGGRTSGFMFTF